MTRDTESPIVEELLPLKPVDFMVLLTLAGGELHGYGLVAEIAERTVVARFESNRIIEVLDGSVDLSTGKQ